MATEMPTLKCRRSLVKNIIEQNSPTSVLKNPMSPRSSEVRTKRKLEEESSDEKGSKRFRHLSLPEKDSLSEDGVVKSRSFYSKSAYLSPLERLEIAKMKVEKGMKLPDPPVLSNINNKVDVKNTPKVKSQKVKKPEVIRKKSPSVPAKSDAEGIESNNKISEEESENCVIIGNKFFKHRRLSDSTQNTHVSMGNKGLTLKFQSGKGKKKTGKAGQQRSPAFPRLPADKVAIPTTKSPTASLKCTDPHELFCDTETCASENNLTSPSSGTQQSSQSSGTQLSNPDSGVFIGSPCSSSDSMIALAGGKNTVHNLSPTSTSTEDTVCLLQVSDNQISPDSASMKKSYRARKNDIKKNEKADGGKKLFSIFSSVNTPPSSPLVRNMKLSGKKSPSTPRNTRGALSANKHRISPLVHHSKNKDGKEQMLIDAGQKNIGATQCSICGMTYSIGEPADEATHSKFHHHLINALKFPGWKKENVVQEFLDGSRIISVLPTDKHALKKVAAVKEIMDEDLGFVVENQAVKANSKTYLYISEEKRIISCCIAEAISQGYRVVSSGEAAECRTIGSGTSPLSCSTAPVPAKCGINRIWVINGERRNGIASKLIDCVRCNFFLGFPLQPKHLAFSDPTPNGKAFATKYTGSPNFLVYKHSV